MLSLSLYFYSQYSLIIISVYSIPREFIGGRVSCSISHVDAILFYEFQLGQALLHFIGLVVFPQNQQITANNKRNESLSIKSTIIFCEGDYTRGIGLKTNDLFHMQKQSGFIYQQSLESKV